MDIKLSSPFSKYKITKELFSDNYISSVRVVSKILDCGLKEAKFFIDHIRSNKYIIYGLLSSQYFDLLFCGFQISPISILENEDFYTNSSTKEYKISKYIEDKVIHAIKDVRDVFGWDLKTSKDFIMEFRKVPYSKVFLIDKQKDELINKGFDVTPIYDCKIDVSEKLFEIE